ncbi:hypothetical protein MMPV_005965 [Pyropia vietnamensis]
MRFPSLPAVAVTAVASIAAATVAVAAAFIDDDCEVAIIGGGIGGAYTAWRLAVDTKTVDPSDVCLFEASHRFGGRIFSVDDVPGYEGFVTDVGAYRFHRTDHPIIRSLTEDALGMETACYTDPTASLPMNVAECPSENQLFTTVRSVSFVGDLEAGTAPNESTWTPKWPFFLSEESKWGAGRPRSSRRKLTDVFVGPNGLIPELATRWTALGNKNATLEEAMALADTTLAALRAGTYKGVPYSEVSVVQIARDAGMTPEEIAIEVGFGTGGAQFFNMNVLALLTNTIRNMATKRLTLAPTGPAAAMVVPVTGKGAARKRAGMASIIHKMVDAARAAGVRIYMDHRAVAVRRKGRRRVIVEFANGGKTKSRRVFLNMGKADLLALGAASEPMASASEDVRRRVDASFPLGASKTYCFWPSAWWLSDLRLSAGRGKSDDPAIVQPRYHDGPVQCTDPANAATCRGGLLVSYAFGDDTGVGSGMWAASHADAPYSPISGKDALTVLVKDRLTPRHKLLWSALVKGIRSVHKPVLSVRKLTSEIIPEPDVCIMASWFDVTLHISRPVPTLGTMTSAELFAAPAKGLPIHLVNEAWGDAHGWAEGSLQSAERALHAHMKLPPPQWLNRLVHTAVIKNFNKG